MQKKWLKRIPRILLWTSGLIIVLGLLISWLVTFGPVQSWLVRQTTWWLESKLSTEVSVRDVDVALPARAVLGGMDVCDPDGQTLLWVESLEIDVFNLELWEVILARDSVDTLSVSRIALKGPEVHLYRKPSGENNWQFLAEAFASDEEKEKNNSLPFALQFPEVLLSGGKFSYVDSSKDDFKELFEGQVNYHNLLVENLGAEIAFDMDTATRVEIDVANFHLQEHYSEWKLEDLGFSILGNTADDEGNLSTYLNHLTLRADSTYLSADISFEQQPLSQILAFDERLRYEAWFASDNQVDFKTISTLAGDTLPIAGIVSLRGPARGSLQQLSSPGLFLGFGRRSELYASVEMNDLIHADLTELDVQIKRGFVAIPDLRNLLTGVPLPDELDEFERLSIRRGEFVGKYADFSTSLQASSAVGGLQAKLDMQLPPLVPLMEYNGNLITDGLNLDRLGVSSSAISQRLNLSAEVKGRGISVDDVNLIVDARVRQSELMGYPLDSLRLYARMVPKNLSGTLWAKEGSSLVDLRLGAEWQTPLPSYTLLGRVQQVNLQTYGLLDQPIELSTYLDISPKGESLETLEGKAFFEVLTLTDSAGSVLELPDIKLIAEAGNDTLPRKITIESPQLLSGKTYGTVCLRTGDRVYTGAD